MSNTVPLAISSSGYMCGGGVRVGSLRLLSWASVHSTLSTREVIVIAHHHTAARAGGVVGGVYAAAAGAVFVIYRSPILVLGIAT